MVLDRPFTIRLALRDIERADALVDVLSRDPTIGGMAKVSRSAVLRIAVMMGLDMLEERYGQRNKRKGR